MTVYKMSPRRHEHVPDRLKGAEARPGSRAVCRACPTMSPSAVSGASPCFSRPTTIASIARLVATAARRAGTAVLAYCLMPNHVHLIVTRADAAGRKFQRSTKRKSCSEAVRASRRARGRSSA